MFVVIKFGVGGGTLCSVETCFKLAWHHNLLFKNCTVVDVF